MNDTHPTIPIWRTVVAGYRLGIGSVFGSFALFRYFVYASLLSLAVASLQFYQTAARLAALTQPQTAGMAILGIATGMLLYVGFAAATSPFAAAVHRRILLGETPRGYYAAARRMQLRFLLVTVAVSALFFLAPLVSNLAVYLIFGLNPLDPLEMSRGYAARPMIAAVTLLLSLLTYVLAALIATRFTFAFPSIAIENPNASLRHSFAETRGFAWRLFFIFLFTFTVPFVILIILYVVASAAFIIGHPELLNAPERLGNAMVYSTPFLIVYALMFVVMMLMIAVTAAAAARAYEIRVGGMTGVAEVFS